MVYVVVEIVAVDIDVVVSVKVVVTVVVVFVTVVVVVVAVFVDTDVVDTVVVDAVVVVVVAPHFGPDAGEPPFSPYILIHLSSGHSSCSKTKHGSSPFSTHTSMACFPKYMFAVRHLGSGHPDEISKQLIVAVLVLEVVVVAVMVLAVVALAVVVLAVVVLAVVVLTVIVVAVVRVVVSTHESHMTGQCCFTRLPRGPESHLFRIR
jgi:hypothetical protein